MGSGLTGQMAHQHRICRFGQRYGFPRSEGGRTCRYHRVPENIVGKIAPAAWLEGTMDAEFFEAAALPLFDQLYNLAHWLTGDRSDAEDLVQETYAKALKGIKTFQEGTNFRAWMYRILRNTFLTSRSGLRVQNTVYLEDEEGDGAVPAHPVTPESIALQLENSTAVTDAIAA